MSKVTKCLENVDEESFLESEDSNSRDLNRAEAAEGIRSVK